MILAGWIIIGIIFGLFIICTVAAAISSAREAREAEGVKYDPDPTAGQGSDVLGGK